MSGIGCRAIALYLPQFHPVAENDAWWGRGFTEWTNVTRAQPRFRGHRQPRLPSDLGFCDLRLPETRAAQAELAKAYGLEGFCYYHYWFSGRRLIDRPFSEVLSSGQPSFPICLCWANESWSRRWLGEERDVLMEQTYSPADDLRHAEWLCGAFADPRYVRVDGRPLFLVYRPKHLPEPQRTTDVLRQQCLRTGLPDPYLVGVDAHCPGLDARTLGFDDTMHFTPQLGHLEGALDDSPSVGRLVRNVGRFNVWSRGLKLYDYREAWGAMQRRKPAFPYLPSVFVGWDNSPRRGSHGVIMVNNTPERFAAAVREAAEALNGRPPAQRLLFVNAWNEWAEGNYLEPDQTIGHGYLSAVAEVLGMAT